MRTLESQQTELIRRIGEHCPLAIVALTMRCGLRVRHLVDHPDVARGMTLALRIGREYCLRDDRRSRARLARSLGYLKTLLDAIEPDAPMETVSYQVENAAVARLSDVVQAHEDANLARMLSMAEFAARSASFAAELAVGEGLAAASDEDGIARGLRRDLEAAAGFGPEITAVDPGPGGPLGPLWGWQNGHPAWEPPGERHGDLTRLSDSEISRLVEYADKKAHLGDILDGATLPDRSGVAGSLEAIGRDIERAASPLPAEFARALREGMPAGEAVAALSAQLDALHRPVVEALRGLLTRLYEAKNLGSAEENARAAEEVNRIAKFCNVHLIHDGNRVALLFREKKNYKTGLFALRSIDNNYSTVYEKVGFPELDVVESSPPQGATLKSRPGATASQIVADIAERHDAAKRPFVEELRGLLTRLHEAKNLGSYEENARAAREVYTLAKSCGMNLIYDGQPVALLCYERAGVKAGLFRVRTLDSEQRTLYQRVAFPALDIAPVAE